MSRQVLFPRLNGCSLGGRTVYAKISEIQRLVLKKFDSLSYFHKHILNTHAHKDTQTHAHVCAHTHTHTHTHTRVRVHSHRHTHTGTHKDKLNTC